MRIPSAGTRSPAWSSTRSPTTRSATGASSTPSCRRTRQDTFSASSWRRRKAVSLPYSDSVDTKVARKMAKAMPATSNQLKLRNKKMTLMARTMSRILMMGSPKLARNCLAKLLRA